MSKEAVKSQIFNESDDNYKARSKKEYHRRRDSRDNVTRNFTGNGKVYEFEESRRKGTDGGYMHPTSMLEKGDVHETFERRFVERNKKQGEDLKFSGSESPIALPFHGNGTSTKTRTFTETRNRRSTKTGVSTKRSNSTHSSSSYSISSTDSCCSGAKGYGVTELSQGYSVMTAEQGQQQQHGSRELKQQRPQHHQVVVEKTMASTGLGSGAGQGYHHDHQSTVPVLKTNKTYNISFALTAGTASAGDLTSSRTMEWGSNGEEKKIYQHQHQHDQHQQRHHHPHHHQHQHQHQHRRRRRRKSNKKLQTDTATGPGSTLIVNKIQQQRSADKSADFEDLMKDVQYDSQRSGAAAAAEATGAASGGGGDWNQADERYRYQQTSGGGSGNLDQVDGKLGSASSYGYQYQRGDGGGNMGDGNVYHTEEMTERKKWLTIEQPDGSQLRHEYREEMNSDGDIKYIDIVSGKVLKTEQAGWKSGEEWVRDGNKTRKMRYEWRQDPEHSNEWIKHNADTNEVLKRGDWKTGTEWYRAKNGKLVERSYQFVPTADGKWMKVDKVSGQVIDVPNNSLNHGHDWKKMKSKSCGKNKDPRWHRVDYEYEQTRRGKWLKKDLETKKQIGKPSKQGWKEGKDFDMTQNGRIRSVPYKWQPDSEGIMKQQHRKTGKPINTVWKEGSEVIMQDNKVTRNEFAWVKSGRNKWIKIDQETGRPLTNKIKSNKVQGYNQSDMSKRKSMMTKTYRQIDNNQMVQENTEIMQGQGEVIRNTTKSVKNLD